MSKLNNLITAKEFITGTGYISLNALNNLCDINDQIITEQSRIMSDAIKSIALMSKNHEEAMKIQREGYLLLEDELKDAEKRIKDFSWSSDTASTQIGQLFNEVERLKNVVKHREIVISELKEQLNSKEINKLKEELEEVEDFNPINIGKVRGWYADHICEEPEVFSTPEEISAELDKIDNDDGGEWIDFGTEIWR